MQRNLGNQTELRSIAVEPLIDLALLSESLSKLPNLLTFETVDTRNYDWNMYEIPKTLLSGLTLPACIQKLNISVGLGVESVVQLARIISDLPFLQLLELDEPSFSSDEASFSSDEASFSSDEADLDFCRSIAASKSLVKVLMAIGNANYLPQLVTGSLVYLSASNQQHEEYSGDLAPDQCRQIISSSKHSTYINLPYIYWDILDEEGSEDQLEEDDLNKTEAEIQALIDTHPSLNRLEIGDQLFIRCLKTTTGLDFTWEEYITEARNLVRFTRPFSGSKQHATRFLPTELILIILTCSLECSVWQRDRLNVIIDCLLNRHSLGRVDSEVVREFDPNILFVRCRQALEGLK